MSLYNADSTINDTDQDGNTCLNLACQTGLYFVVKNLLADPMCNVNKKNDADKTPLFNACSKNYHDIVELLLTTKKCNITKK